MNEYVTVVLLLTGTAFLLLAAVGVARMPDLFSRMHATTKAATLGASLTLLAVAVYFGDFGITARAFAIIFFLFVTAPVVAHMLGRTAHFIGVNLWQGTVIDELKERYSKESEETGRVPVSEDSEAATENK